MSFRTYADYNDDNVARTIEFIIEREDYSLDDKSSSKLDKLLKGALNVRIRIDTFHSDVYERTLDHRWYNWTEHTSYSDTVFKKMLSELKEGVDYEVLKI